MAKVHVHWEIIEELVFGFSSSPVVISDVSFDGESGDVTFEISGDDVPDAPEVLPLISVQRNRADQRLVTLTFVPAGGAYERDPLKLGAEPVGGPK